MTPPLPRLYRDLAGWWPLLSPPSEAHDRHVEGIFTRAQWLQWFRDAGMPAQSSIDPWGRDLFLGTRQGA